MKKYLLNLTAIALAIGFSAFTIANKNNQKKYSSFQWFAFEDRPQFNQMAQATCMNGDADNTTEAYNERNYVPMGNVPNCAGSTKLCEIYAESQTIIVGGTVYTRPIITLRPILQTEILFALCFGILDIDISLKD